MFPEYSGVCFLDEEKKKYLYKVQYVHKTLTVCDVYFTCRKIMLVPSPWRTSTSQLPLGQYRSVASSTQSSGRNCVEVLFLPFCGCCFFVGLHFYFDKCLV